MEQNNQFLVQALIHAQSVKISRSHSIQTADRASTSLSLFFSGFAGLLFFSGLLLIQMFFVKYWEC